MIIHMVVSDIIEYSPNNLTDKSILVSLLVSLDSSLSTLLWKSSVFYSIPFTPTVATPVYTQSSLVLPLQTSSKYLVIQYISLNSSEYKLKEKPSLFKQYESPVILEILFTPLFKGIRTAYLLIVTDETLFIMYFQGISVDLLIILTKSLLSTIQNKSELEI